MNKFCTLVLLLIIISALTFASINPVHGLTMFNSGTQFAIPENNGQLNFAVGGSYDSAALENNTWNFVGLALDNYLLDLTEARGFGGVIYGRDVLEYSHNGGNFSVSLQNCEINITNYDIWGMFGPSHGWLNYTVSGIGDQSFNLYYARLGIGPIGWDVYIDDVAAAQNEGWTISTDGWLTVSGATSNVSIHWEWIKPVRDPLTEPKVYIRADGSVEGTDKIQREGNVYTFTATIFDPLVVGRDDVVVDGGGFSVLGPHSGPAQSPEGIGILVEGRDHVILRNVTIQNFMYGIYVNSSMRSQITKTIITNNVKGIYIGHSSGDNIIRESQITDNLDVGIYVFECSDTVVVDNVIENNANWGVSLFFASSNLNETRDCHIDSCSIRDNGVGLRIINPVNSHNRPLVIYSNITNNGIGIHLESSSAYIQFNNIAYNEVGIQVDGSDNRVDRNNFINNTKQVYDIAWDTLESVSSVNTWYAGDSGNYWSDYNGAGDTPYVIDENNQDPLPINHPIRISNEPGFPDIKTFFQHQPFC
jgi:parallel beta-helix repeat protein